MLFLGRCNKIKIIEFFSGSIITIKLHLIIVIIKALDYYTHRIK